MATECCESCGRWHDIIKEPCKKNPYLDRLAKAGNPGKKSEKKVAKKMGARLHPNSGAMRGAKSDASMGAFRLEMKSTQTQTMALDLAWLVKIAQEALAHSQSPAVVLSFTDPGGTPRMRQFAEWVVMPLALFKEITHED
jgi:hypothetical protein